MNYEGLEPKTYYEKKWKEHVEFAKYYCYAMLLGVALAAAIGLFLGGCLLGSWLMGGA